MSDQALKQRVARAIYYATARNKPYEQLSATQRGQKMAEAQDAIRAALTEPDMTSAAFEAAVDAAQQTVTAGHTEDERELEIAHDRAYLANGITAYLAALKQEA